MSEKKVSLKILVKDSVSASLSRIGKNIRDSLRGIEKTQENLREKNDLFSLSFRALKGPVSSFGAFAVNVFGLIINSIKKAITLTADFTKKLTIGLIGFTTFAVKSASDVETLRQNIDTLTGSTEEGAKMMKFIIDYAKKTPFIINNLAESTQTMLAFGISADETKDILKVLGDISLGNNEKLQRLTLAFSQMRTAGRLMGQDLLQMIDAGFNPLEIIAKNTGKSMFALRKEMEEGAISADMVRDAFIQATQKGERFYNGAEKGAEVLKGRFSILWDSIMIVSRGMIGLSETGEIVEGTLLHKVAKAVEFLIGKLNENQEYLINLGREGYGFLIEQAEKLIHWIVQNKDQIIEFVQRGITVAVKAFKDLISWVKTNKDTLIEFASTVGVLALGAIQRLVTWVIALGKWISDNEYQISYWIEVVGSAIKIVGGFIAKLIEFIATIIWVGGTITNTISIMLGGSARSKAQRDSEQMGNALQRPLRSSLDIMNRDLNNFAPGHYQNRYINDLNNNSGRLKDAISNPVLQGVNSANQNLSLLSAKIRGVIDQSGRIQFDVGIPGQAKAASGTNYFSGGVLTVGERGPEKVFLPKGSRVMRHTDSQKAGNTYNISINNPSVRRDSDLKAIADMVVSVIDNRQRNTNFGV